MATKTPLDEQIERLKTYLQTSKQLQKPNTATADHIAIEQALATAYLAKEVASK